VSYAIADMKAFMVELTASIDGYNSDCMITCSDVIATVHKLKSNKGDGNTGLSSDHVKRACLDLSAHIALITTGMLFMAFCQVMY
jgi:hypothetical protein